MLLTCDDGAAETVVVIGFEADDRLDVAKADTLDVVVDDDEGCGTWTNGTIRPLEFLTNVAGTSLPLGNMTGIVPAPLPVPSGSSVW